MTKEEIMTKEEMVTNDQGRNGGGGQGKVAKEKEKCKAL
jgi:hypothetical protein